MEDFTQGRNVTELPHETTRFDWDTTVQGLLPPKSPPVFASPWARSQATFRDVLSHISGVGRRVMRFRIGAYANPPSDCSQDFVYGDEESPISLLQRMQHLRPAYELRERFSYTNMVNSYLLSAGLGTDRIYSSTRSVHTLSPSTLV